MPNLCAGQPGQALCLKPASKRKFKNPTFGRGSSRSFANLQPQLNGFQKIGMYLLFRLSLSCAAGQRRNLGPKSTLFGRVNNSF